MKFEETIKFTKEEFDNAIDKAFENKKNDIKLDGFRKGKVPKDVYYKKAGKESLYMEALDILLPEAYDKAIEKHTPVMEPKVDIKSISEDGVELLFTIITKPEIEIKKYKGLNVEKQTPEVTQEEIDHEIKHLLERYTEFEVKDGKVENTDIAVIDFEGFLGDEPFEGGKGENHSLEIGSKSFIPGFEEQLIGMKAGEKKDIKVTFPEDYHAEDLKGKEATFKVKVNEVKSKITRQLDKEFFEDLGLEGVDSKEKLEEEIKNNIMASKERQNEEEYIDKVLGEIAKNSKAEIPEELIDDELTHMIKNFEEQIKMQGASLDVFYAMTKTTEEDLRKQMKPEAEKHIMYRLIIGKVQELENIKVDEKELEEEIENLAKRYAVSKEEFLNMYGDKEMFGYELEVKKTLEFLSKENKK